MSTPTFMESSIWFSFLFSSLFGGLLKSVFEQVKFVILEQIQRIIIGNEFLSFSRSFVLN